jgi:hypothetical protein
LTWHIFDTHQLAELVREIEKQPFWSLNVQLAVILVSDSREKIQNSWKKNSWKRLLGYWIYEQNEEDKEMKRKKIMHNNKIWKKNKRNELLLGYWMYKEDKKMKRKKKSNVILVSDHIIHPHVSQMFLLCVPCVSKKSHISFFIKLMIIFNNSDQSD